MEPYVRNLWYMAAWEEEIPDRGFISRTLLDLPWLILRQDDGAYAMLADRCPHRFAPLSRGTREGDTIRCGYHGLAFDTAGRCVHNPFGGFLPPGARVQVLPAVARDGAIWFWPGDPDRADQALIPDFSFIEEEPDVVRGRTWMGANYELITDNLMDLSHVEFMHVETFGSNGAMFTGEHRSVHDGASGIIWSNWNMANSEPSERARALVPKGTRVDHWLEMRWNAPASMALFIGTAVAGTDRKDLLRRPMANPHIITPETRESSHYFFTRSPGDESEALARRVFNEEDQPMIEAVQRSMADRDFWDMKPVSLASDAAAIAVRRSLQRLRRSEAPARTFEETV